MFTALPANVAQEPKLPKRFAFRQVCSRDFPVFLQDGEIRSKNHCNPQSCHQTSYPEIVNRRGTEIFELPHGGVVNDYVAFYLSPKTSFTYTIHKGNVRLVSPDGVDLGVATDDERIFFVVAVEPVLKSDLQYCFSDFPLNSRAPMPKVECEPGALESHVHWNVFDEQPVGAAIPEIGYEGVCSYFMNQDSPPERQNRSQKRMAEFLVRDCVPLSFVTCVVTKTAAVQAALTAQMAASNWRIPILAKPGCYF